MKKQKLTKTITIVVYTLLAAILFTGCAQVTPVQECVVDEPYGFWGGLWHGIIVPIAFVISLFDDSVAIYAVNNNDGWYNFGFVIGAGILFGGSGRAKR